MTSADPPQRLGDYRLDETLVSSETAAVHLARDPRGRRVVVKRFADREAERGAHAELDLLGLEHPGIAALLDCGRTVGERALYMVHEFVAGRSPRPGEVPVAPTQLAAPLLAAVAFVHERGLLHRDIKAANVVVDDVTQQPVLIDFGLCCLAADSERVPLSGTPRAMAPELFAGATATVVSDLWACGLLLAEALLGRRLFVAETPAEMLAERRAFTGLPEGVDGPRALVKLIERLLDPEPGRRPEDARSAIAALPEELRRGVGRDELLARLSVTLGAFDSELAARKEALRSGALWIPPLPDDAHGLDETVARLVELAGGVTSPDALLETRLDRARHGSRAARPVDVAGLLSALTTTGPVVLGVSSRARAAVQEVVRLLEADGRVELVPIEAPGAGVGPDVVRAWIGPQPALESRLRATPPETIEALDDALRALVARGAVEVGSAGVRVDESRVPDAWPLSPRALPAGIEALGVSAREVFDALALAPWPVDVALVAEVLERDVDADVEALERGGWIRRDGNDYEHGFAAADTGLARVGAAAARLGAAARARLARAVGARADVADEHVAAAIAASVVGVDPEHDDPPEVGRLLESVAASLNRVHRLDLAASVSRRALAGCPDEARRRELRISLIDALIKNGAHDEALAELEQALAAFPDAVPFRLRVARVHELRGDPREGLRRLEGLDPADLPDEQAVEFLRDRFRMLVALGRIDDAMIDLREALRRQGEAPHRRRMALLEQAGTLEEALGHDDEAVRYYEASIAMARELGHEGLVGSPMFNMGRAIRNRGEKRRGLALQEQAIEITERAGDVVSLASQLNSLGAGWLTMGRVDKARRYLDRALELARELGDSIREGMVLNNTARALAAEGRYDEAEHLFAQSLDLRGRRGDRRGQAAVALTRARVHATQAKWDEVQADVERALEWLDGLDAPDWRIEAGLLGGEAALAGDELDAARAAAEDARGLAERAGLRPERLRASTLTARAGGDDLEAIDVESEERGPWLADLLFVRAGLRAAAGRDDDADDDLALALSILGETPDGPIEARGLLVASRIDLDRLERAPEDDAAWLSRAGEWLARIARNIERSEALVSVHGLADVGERLGDVRARFEAQSRRLGAGGVVSLVERLHALERLSEINKELSSERDTQRLLELIVDSAIELTGAARGFLILFDGRAEEFRAARNIDESTIHNPEFEVSHSVARRVVQTGEPLITDNAIDDSRLSRAASISALKLLSIVCVPLVSRSRVIGAIYLDHPQVVGRFGRRHQQTVTALAEQASIALENARLSDGLAASNRELRVSREEIARLNEALKDRLDQREAELEEVRESLDASRRVLEARYDYSQIVTRSPRMLEILELLDRVTDTHFPVIIHGESGTGKELIARALHFNGPRKERHFVSLNCAAIAEPLIESELFGSIKGAFTGADRDRAGLFEEAHEGTLFLDEIGDMSLDVQKRLLRVLQEGEFLPVGGREVKRVDVRVLCATHRDLATMVGEGRFREDLYYRLAVARVALPPLRDRVEDLPLLIGHFLERHGSGSRGIEPDALALLQAHTWPGNVRELENFTMNVIMLDPEGQRLGADLVRRLLAVASGREPQAPVDAGTAGLGGALKERLEAFERREVERALSETEGNKTQAAARLGVSVRTLYKMIARLGL